jgi:hypothetical protein
MDITNKKQYYGDSLQQILQSKLICKTIPIQDILIIKENKQKNEIQKDFFIESNDIIFIRADMINNLVRHMIDV